VRDAEISDARVRLGELRNEAITRGKHITRHERRQEERSGDGLGHRQDSLFTSTRRISNMSGKKGVDGDHWANLGAKDALSAGKSDTANMGRFKIKVSNGERRGSGEKKKLRSASGNGINQLFSPRK